MKVVAEWTFWNSSWGRKDAQTCQKKRWQFELEEYIRQGEPGQVARSEAWKTAIGLQAVDGLQTSAYLLDTAKEHIEGKINIDEAQKRIQSFLVKRHFNFHRQNGCLFIGVYLRGYLNMQGRLESITLRRKNGC